MSDWSTRMPERERPQEPLLMAAAYSVMIGIGFIGEMVYRWLKDGQWPDRAMAWLLTNMAGATPAQWKTGWVGVDWIVQWVLSLNCAVYFVFVFPVIFLVLRTALEVLSSLLRPVRPK